MPQSQVAALGITKHSTVQAILADGSRLNLEVYICRISWLSQELDIEAIANQGQLPLIGVGLLDGHYLAVDYQNKTVEIR